MTPAQYVVRIRDENGRDGSGFLLNSRCDVATCWHVVRDVHGQISVTLPSFRPWVYDVLVKSEDEDVAVLRSPDPPPWKFDYPKLHPHWFEADKTGTWVEVLGYSNDPNAEFAHHKNCNISNIYNRFGLMVLNGHVYPGDSGGPVRNNAGHVIGITTFSDDDRPGQVMIRPISRLCKLLDDQKIPFDVTKGSGQLAKRALVSLLNPPHVPPVLNVIRRYGSVFANASSQLSALHAYKKAHDLLHEVQFIHDGLGNAADHFPEQDWARNLVTIYVFQLRKHLSDADDILRTGLNQTDLVAVRDQLGEACSELEDAAEQRDLAACSRAIRRLDIMLLRPEQSNFNALLKAAARDLNMQNLIDAMQSVQEALHENLYREDLSGKGAKAQSTTAFLKAFFARLRLSARNVFRPSMRLVTFRAKPVQEAIFTEANSATSDDFQLGIDDIKELDKELSAQIEEHDKWQLVENMLRPLDKNSPTLLSDLELGRRRLMSNIRAFCNASKAAQPEGEASSSNWATRMEHEATNLENALFSGDSKQTSEHFDLLRRYVTEHFDRVDKRLLLLCERISKVRDPLGVLVENWT